MDNNNGFKRVKTISLFEAGLYLAGPGERDDLGSFDQFGEGAVYVIEGRELGLLFDFLGVQWNQIINWSSGRAEEVDQSEKKTMTEERFSIGRELRRVEVPVNLQEIWAKVIGSHLLEIKLKHGGDSPSSVSWEMITYSGSFAVKWYETIEENEKE